MIPINNEINTQFKGMNNYILNKFLWEKNCFYVFNNEAGTGKSTEVKKSIAKVTDSKVVYVQLFSKNEELIKSANEINKEAGKEIAFAYFSDTIKYTEKAKNSQILCITHNMYKEICIGKHSELFNGRKILIIDEFPEMMESISIGIHDLQDLWGDLDDNDVEIIANALRDKLIEYKNRAKNEMSYQKFSKEYDKYKSMVDAAIKETTKENVKKTLNKIKIIMENGFVYFEDKFYYFNTSCKFKMLECNIILDANAGFDYRYRLSNLFKVIEQPRVFDYSESHLVHFNLQTSKCGHKKNPETYKKGLEKVEIKPGDKILFIADCEGEERLKQAILWQYKQYGENIEEIQKALGAIISINHFGAIKGENAYREYNKVAILKTPNFQYITYYLNKLYYTSEKVVGGHKNVKVFDDAECELIRNSAVAGEMYQAIKRINRKNSKPAIYYVFCSNEDAMDILREQFKNIKYSKFNLLEENKGRTTEKRENAKSAERVVKAQEFLFDCKNRGLSSVKKGELRNVVGITDKGNFTRFLQTMGVFFSENGILVTGQTLVFKNNGRKIYSNKSCGCA